MKRKKRRQVRYQISVRESTYELIRQRALAWGMTITEYTESMIRSALGDKPEILDGKIE